MLLTGLSTSFRMFAKRGLMLDQEYLQALLSNPQEICVILLLRLRNISSNYYVQSVIFNKELMRFEAMSDGGDIDFIYIDSDRFECLYFYDENSEMNQFLGFTPRQFPDLE